MTWLAVDALKQRIPLLDYLQEHDWKPLRRLCHGRLLGLCPLHPDHNPSFLVEPSKNLFYCYGCGRGGDVIRFVQLFYGVSFLEALALLRQSSDAFPVLESTVSYYRMQLHRHPEAARYLHARGITQPHVIEDLQIGYAPGRCLRRWLMGMGYELPELRQAGLITSMGQDTLAHRIVFPLQTNLYGRSIGNAAPHRFLPGSKGGLYRWDRVQHYPEIILVEGVFDVAALLQAGFHNVTCAFGTHLNALQRHQLCRAPKTVILAFDSDPNGSGQRAAQRLAHELSRQGLHLRRALLPQGHDPNSFFVRGGDPQQFRSLLQGALDDFPRDATD
jgi:DNA primase